ncbi:hypothetical protein C8J56DRAFT_1161640 [Mycena floridula]|nr:hypothetical protein C8J56DRAFT_1161640 [Mycena floridula]
MPDVPRIFTKQRFASSTDPRSDLRRGMSLPLLIMSGVPIGEEFINPNRPNNTQLPPTPGGHGSSEAFSDGLDSELKHIWTGITATPNAKSAKNVSKSWRRLLRGEQMAVNTAKSTVAVAKDFLSNEEVQIVGKAIVSGIPAIMNAFEMISEIHPFVKLAYQPFRLFYEQEMKRRDNNEKRQLLFEKMKDAIVVLLDLRTIKRNDTGQSTPSGEPLLDRLEVFCVKMAEDIKKCWNVVDASDKCSLIVKFFQAGSWNAQFASYLVIFEDYQSDLQFALQMHATRTLNQVAEDVREQRKTNQRILAFLEQLTPMQTPEEQTMAKKIRDSGSENALNDNKTCRALLEQEDILNPTMPDKFIPKARSDPDYSSRISDLRQEYHKDVGVIVQENMARFEKIFRLGMDQLKKQLSVEIKHSGDRVISVLSFGPHMRIKDKVISTFPPTANDG